MQRRQGASEAAVSRALRNVVGGVDGARNCAQNCYWRRNSSPQQGRQLRDTICPTTMATATAATTTTTGVATAAAAMDNGHNCSPPLGIEGVVRCRRQCRRSPNSRSKSLSAAKQQSTTIGETVVRHDLLYDNNDGNGGDEDDNGGGYSGGGNGHNCSPTLPTPYSLPASDNGGGSGQKCQRGQRRWRRPQ